MAGPGPEGAVIASKRSNPETAAGLWIASSLALLAMTAKASPSLRASEAIQSGAAAVWIASSRTLLAMTPFPSLRAKRSNPETAVRLSGLLRRF
jgi:hypothetical protein